MSLTVIEHPLVQVNLGLLRDEKTTFPEFRRILRETAALMFYSVTQDLPTVPITVQTPLAPCPARRLERPVVLAPILRAGLGLMEGLFELIPDAQVAHLGIYRDEDTLQPVSYYARVPEGVADTEVILLDPMLATGHSAAAAVTALKGAGARRIRFLCLVSCPPGIEYFRSVHPDVPVFTAAVDERLNERGYIVPGLGDAGGPLFRDVAAAATMRGAHSWVFPTTKGVWTGGGGALMFDLSRKAGLSVPAMTTIVPSGRTHPGEGRKKVGNVQPCLEKAEGRKCLRHGMGCEEWGVGYEMTPRARLPNFCHPERRPAVEGPRPAGYHRPAWPLTPISKTSLPATGEQITAYSPELSLKASGPSSGCVPHWARSFDSGPAALRSG